jgi:hypothetical protein
MLSQDGEDDSDRFESEQVPTEAATTDNDESCSFKGNTYSFLRDDEADDGLEAQVERRNAANLRKAQQQNRAAASSTLSSTTPAGKYLCMWQCVYLHMYRCIYERAYISISM